jgi:hypothetical protein
MIFYKKKYVGKNNYEKTSIQLFNNLVKYKNFSLEIENKILLLPRCQLILTVITKFWHATPICKFFLTIFASRIS